MSHLLGFLFVVIIAIVAVVFSVFVGVLRGVFGWGKRMAGGSRRRDEARRTTGDEAQPEEGNLRPKRKKLFDKDEGEYVDFEEVKE